jgi:hypothetical protein
VELLEGLSFTHDCNSDGSTDGDGECTVVCDTDKLQLLQASMTSTSEGCAAPAAIMTLNDTSFTVTNMSFSSLDSIVVPAEEGDVGAAASAAVASGCLDDEEDAAPGSGPMRVTSSSCGGSSCGGMGSDAGGDCGSVVSEVTAVGVGGVMVAECGIDVAEGDMEVCSMSCVAG